MAEQSNRVGSGFTEGELQFANFWVRNRIIIRQGLWAFLIGINVLFWGYSLWGLFDAYVLSWPRESRITQEIAQNQFIAQSLESNRPSGIQSGRVSVFEATENRLDMIVPVQNPNPEWWATFTYRFNVSGENTPERSGYLLPGEDTYLGEFGYDPETRGARSAVLTVNNIQWHRVDPGQVGASYEEWLSRRNGFEFQDLGFESNLTIGNRRISRTHFTLVNTTAYGYWELGLYVLLMRADSPVAATYIKLDRMKPLEQRPVAIDWFESLPSISDTVIIPHVNFLDESEYLPTSFIE